jgi:tetratricopeptide (TPR) repeat protein
MTKAKGPRAKRSPAAPRAVGRRPRPGRLAAWGAGLALAVGILAARSEVARAVYQRMPLGSLEQFTRDHPDAEAAAVLGRRLIDAGDSGRAVEALRAFTDARTAPGDLWLLRAEAELEVGEDRLAYGSARVGLGSAAHPARGHWILGRVADRAGSEDEAQAEFRRSTDLDPALADAWIRRGRYSLRYAMPGTALEQFRRALAAAPRGDEAAVGSAEALVAMGRLPEAEAAARDAVAWNPASARAHFWLGRILAAEGDPARAREAEAELKTATARSTSPELCQHYLGALYLQQGEIERALEAFRAAIASQPLQKTSYPLLAQCYRRLGRAAEAEEVLRNYCRLDEIDLTSAQLEYRVWAAPRDVRLRLELARVYLKFGRPDLARTQLDMAQRLAPYSPAVQELLARLPPAGRG